MVINNRFLGQTNYIDKKNFVLDILAGMGIGDAINKHAAINMQASYYVPFSPRVLNIFLRALKATLLDDSRNNTPEQHAEYKSLNLFAGLDYLRAKHDLIFNYITLLENEADQNRTQDLSSSDAGVRHCDVHAGYPGTAGGIPGAQRRIFPSAVQP